MVSNKQKTGITINRDSFKKNTPITYSKTKNEIILTIENNADFNHNTKMTLFSKSKWQVFIDDRKLNPDENKLENTKTFILPISNKQHIISLKQ